MAYNDNPVGSSADLVRVKAGDTGSSPVLSDEAIEAFLSNNNNNILLAAADAAEALAAYYAQNQVESEAEEGAASTRSRNFLMIADRLRAQAEEAKRQSVSGPGCSSAAFSRSALFGRGVGYGGE
jgi:hypothetical protein